MCRCLGGERGGIAIGCREIANCKLQIANWKTGLCLSFCNLHFAIRNLQLPDQGLQTLSNSCGQRVKCSAKPKHNIPANTHHVQYGITTASRMGGTSPSKM